jgi:hypothetical protein
MLWYDPARLDAICEPTMRLKAVYLNGVRIGSAKTWHEAAKLVGEFLGRNIPVPEVVRDGSEGPDGFYVELPR